MSIGGCVYAVEVPRLGIVRRIFRFDHCRARAAPNAGDRTCYSRA